MSFYNTQINLTNKNDTPMLVENKVLRKIKKKKIQIKKNSYSNKVKKSCLEFIKNNYGILIIISILLVLLYFRYKDVKKRRKLQGNVSI